MLSKSIVDKPAASVLIRDCIGRADVSLVGKKDDDGGTVTIGRISKDFRRDPGVSIRRGCNRLGRVSAPLILGEGGRAGGDAKPNQRQEGAN
jgi:hypothetical protein